MEGKGQIAETLCEVAEEVPWRKLLTRKPVTKVSQKSAGDAGAGTLFYGADATLTNEARMEGFNETDAANLQRVKDAMAERATGGGLVSGPDAAAASAFAALLDAETRREELRLKSAGVDKGQATAPAPSWTDAVRENRQASAEPVLAA